jgi:hypothetical protein
LVLALASICGFELWTLDISQAFLQAANENMRDIFLQPPKEMELSSDEFLKQMKPLYGLCDSGDRCHHTLRHHHVQDLQMSTAKFAGVNLRQTESGIETDMSDYIEKLTFPLEQSWRHFVFSALILSG